MSATRTTPRLRTCCVGRGCTSRPAVSIPEAEPYFFHSLRVMLSFDGVVEQIVAVLHDAVEDTELQLHDLAEAGYSSEVLAAIQRSPDATARATRTT